MIKLFVQRRICNAITCASGTGWISGAWQEKRNLREAKHRERDQQSIRVILKAREANSGSIVGPPRKERIFS
jgi:hypothetical protein